MQTFIITPMYRIHAVGAGKGNVMEWEAYAHIADCTRETADATVSKFVTGNFIVAATEAMHLAIKLAADTVAMDVLHTQVCINPAREIR